MSDRQRLFFAVPLTDEAREGLDRSIGGSLRALEQLRPIPPQNWHLTLRFLGDTSAAERLAVEARLDASRLPPPFRFQLGGWGAFPRPGAARVLWIGVRDPASGLATLNRQTEEAATSAGFEPDPRAYSPHLTIARLRDPANLRATLASLPTFEIDCEVDRIVLYRSEFGSGGVRYVDVRAFRLGG
jgi:RNA 2',3'-cyclic 3'-phosphodiesterase